MNPGGGRRCGWKSYDGVKSSCFLFRGSKRMIYLKGKVNFLNWHFCLGYQEITTQGFRLQEPK